MENIQAEIGKQNYKTLITNASQKNFIIADEPMSIGGQGLGFTPTELLASSLAACTSITLKMYFDRKEWEFEKITVDVNIDTDKEANSTQLNRIIRINGALDESQRARVISIANACPIHKILTGQMHVVTLLEK